MDPDCGCLEWNVATGYLPGIDVNAVPDLQHVGALGMGVALKQGGVSPVLGGRGPGLVVMKQNTLGLLAPGADQTELAAALGEVFVHDGLGVPDLLHNVAGDTPDPWLHVPDISDMPTAGAICPLPSASLLWTARAPLATVTHSLGLTRTRLVIKMSPCQLLLLLLYFLYPLLYLYFLESTLVKTVILKKTVARHHITGAHWHRLLSGT